MRKLYKFLIAVLLTVCLPLQGIAGVTMPACAEHDQSMQTMSVSTDEGAMEHCNHAMASHDGKMDKNAHAKCYACYLSVAQAIAPSLLSLAPAGTVAGSSDLLAPKYQTRLAPPFHPPRPALALG